MRRSHILAREVRGTAVVVLVALLMVWLFAKLNDDQAAARERVELAGATTIAVETTTTTTTIVVSDRERLCSLSTAFRDDLSMIPIQLVNPAGDSISTSDDRRIDVGLHPEGDLPLELRGQRARPRGLNEEAEEAEEADLTADSEQQSPAAVPPAALVNPDRVDPVASGLLGLPQKLALNYYTAASSLRLGLIDADFDAAADYFTDLVSIGEPAFWDLTELAEGDFSDRWIALTTQPVVGVDASLAHIEESCSIRIGTGFLYREKAPELPILEQVEVPAIVDPSLLPSNRSPAPADG